METTPLKKEQIQFIDKFLQKSDVIFVDIRAEMTDHIASAVEEKMREENLDFYDAFKDYIIKNKKELLATNNKMFRPYLEGIINFSKTFYKPYNLIFALLLVFGFQYLNDIKTLKMIHYGLFLSVTGFLIIQLVWTYVITKKRYFYLEKTLFSLTLIYYIDLFINGFGYKNFNGTYSSLAITVFLFFAFTVHYIETIRKFKLSHL